MTVTEASPRFGIDPMRWPDITSVPHSPVRAAVARNLFRGAVRKLPLRVIEPAALVRRRDERVPVMRLVRPEAFFARVGDSGTIGFGEAYMAGDWVHRRPAGRPHRLRGADAGPHPAGPAAAARRRPAPAAPRRRTTTRSTARGRTSTATTTCRTTCSQLFLDETTTYSSAIFDGDPAGSSDTLTEAQQRKIDRLLYVAGVRSGTRLLEIGTGWGALAIRAAERGGARHHVDHLDRAGRVPASARIAAAGFADRVDLQLRDYREALGSLRRGGERRDDRGGRRQPLARRVLRHRRPRAAPPGGRFGLQAILQHDWTVRWRRRTPTPGSGSTSSPAATCVRSRRSSGHWPRTRRPARRRPGCGSGGTTPRRCTAGGRSSSPASDQGRGAGVRRDVPPHVVALPRLLRGRLPYRLSRRRPVHHRQNAAGG